MSVVEIFKTMHYGPAPESPSQVELWLKQRGPSKHFIGGQWQVPNSKTWFDSHNPANGKRLARIAQGNEKDVNAAVKAAKLAQAPWAALSGHHRARYLYALARLLQKHSRMFAVLESMDNGKTIRETRDIDIPLVIRHFYHHAGWAQLMDEPLAGFEAVGVVGQVIPWNFPLLMLSWKIAPAIAAGNTVVLKPAEFTSLSALLFAEICQEAQLPAGVVNIITGDGSTGALLVEHKGIDKIAFTGSTEVGRHIRRSTAGQGKKLSLELGGKSPFIVFDDADLDSAVEGVVDAIWFNQGQVCCAGSRLLVQESIAQEFYKKLQTRMSKFRIGDPLDKANDMGAIVDPIQLQRIESLVAKGVEEGAVLWQPQWQKPAQGCFYPPTLMTNVTQASFVVQEEIFGPVLVAMSFRTPSEVVCLANNSRYGLAASIWSESISLALHIAPQLDVGVVWINCTNLFDAACGFGGNRESGFGREGGLEGMWEYLKPVWEKNLPWYSPHAKAKSQAKSEKSSLSQLADQGVTPLIDRTAKLFIGGKQARPDGGYSYAVQDPAGHEIALVGEGNRKDIRNAVEAAHKSNWSASTPHLRAQILYYLAENLEARADEFVKRICAMCGVEPHIAQLEVTTAIVRLFYYAAQADKYDGRVHTPPLRGVALAMNEPIGVMALICPEECPLLGFISLVAPAIAMGNRVVVQPSKAHPLSATDLYQVLETSDLPAGVINIVTASRDDLSLILANHHAVESIWYVGSVNGCKKVEEASCSNLKRTWVNNGKQRDWFNVQQGQGQHYLHHATQVKNIWVPYGE